MLRRTSALKALVATLAVLVATVLPVSPGAATTATAADEACPALPSVSLASEPVPGAVGPGGQACFELPATAQGPVLVKLASSVPTATDADGNTTGTMSRVLDANGRMVCNVWAYGYPRCELTGPAPYRLVVVNLPDTVGASFGLRVLDPDDQTGCRPASAAAPGARPAYFALAPHGASQCVALPDDSDQVLWSVAPDPTVETVVLDGEAEPVCVLPEPPGTYPTQGCFFGAHPAPYSVVVSNLVDVDRNARVLLRSDPADEPGCSPAGPLGAAGPRPLTGSNTGRFGITCHYVDLTEVGTAFAVDRYHLDNRRLPGVWAYRPDGELQCADSRPTEVQVRTPDCGVEVAGRFVFVVLGQKGTEGGYRVELGCDRDDCPRDDTVIDLTGARPSSGARVGNSLRADGATVFPDNAEVTYRWMVNGMTVGWDRQFTPRPADVGQPLRLVTTATHPGRTTAVVQGAARTIGLGRIQLDGPASASGSAQVGRTVRAARPRISAPLRGATVTYRWLRDRRPIAGATGASYRVRSADRGHRLQARLVLRADGYATATVRTPARVVH